MRSRRSRGVLPIWPSKESFRSAVRSVRSSSIILIIELINRRPELTGCPVLPGTPSRYPSSHRGEQRAGPQSGTPGAAAKLRIYSKAGGKQIGAHQTSAADYFGSGDGRGRTSGA